MTPDRYTCPYCLEANRKVTYLSQLYFLNFQKKQVNSQSNKIINVRRKSESTDIKFLKCITLLDRAVEGRHR